MKKDQHQKARVVFHALCSLDPADRDAALDQMCHDDPDLRSYVQALLESDSETDDAFAERNLGVGQRLLPMAAGTARRPFAPHHGAFLPGTRFADRYRIVCLLGSGGMGEVYRADDMRLGSQVALKFLPNVLSTNARALDYFLNEVRLARQIAHPNVCRVYDIGEEDGYHFISMEFVDGEDLRSLLRRIGSPSTRKAAEIARQICLGLSAAHAQGVLHRDLKPANVMIDGRGQAIITDFGLARLTSDENELDLLGTPAYMAPEQESHGVATIASDIYSLGLVLYEVFTGGPYPKSQSNEDLQATSPGFSVTGVDPSLEQIITACLSHEPDQRPKSALSVAATIPGQDSVEATLAIGETPSPEMVAATDEAVMTPLTNLATVVGILIGIVAIGGLSHLSQNAIGFRPDELIQITRARELVEQFGYQSAVADTSWGLEWNEHYFNARRAGSPELNQWVDLTGAPPTAVTFWFRSSPNPLVSRQGHGPYAALFVTPNDPPNVEPGMVRLRLGSNGRLYEFLAVPMLDRQGQTLASEGRTNSWRTQLLTAVGIDSKSLQQMNPVDPRDRLHPPPVYADTWEAWQSENVIVEMAGYMGKPVFFRVVPKEPDAPVPTPRPFGILFSLSVLALFTIAVLMARRRWLDKSADRRGARHMFIFVLLTSLLYWSLQAHHVGSGEELAMILKTVGRALLRAVLICAAYLALEPFLRRLWPRSLVGWNRLIRGDIRDSIVRRDLLVGIATGVVAQLVGSAGLLFGDRRQIVLLADPILNIGSGPFDLNVMVGPQSAMGQLCAELFLALVGGFIACPLLFVILRVLLRKTWLAVIGFLLFYSTPALVSGDVHGALTVATWAAIALFVFFRFGVLAVVVGWFAWRILAWPVSFDPTAAHLNVGVIAHLAIATLVFWVYVASLRERGHLVGKSIRRSPQLR